MERNWNQKEPDFWSQEDINKYQSSEKFILDYDIFSSLNYLCQRLKANNIKGDAYLKLNASLKKIIDDKLQEFLDLEPYLVYSYQWKYISFVLDDIIKTDIAYSKTYTQLSNSFKRKEQVAFAIEYVKEMILELQSKEENI